MIRAIEAPSPAADSLSTTYIVVSSLPPPLPVAGSTAGGNNPSVPSDGTAPAPEDTAPAPDETPVSTPEDNSPDNSNDNPLQAPAPPADDGFVWYTVEWSPPPAGHADGTPPPPPPPPPVWPTNEKFYFPDAPPEA